MMVFDKLWQDILALLILLGFALIIYSRIQKKPVTDVIRELKEAVTND